MKNLNQLNFFRKPSNNTDDFSIRRWFCSCNWKVNSSGALWKIPTENSVGDSLYNWHDEQCSQFTNGFTDGFIPSVIPLVKMTHHHFFLLCFNFFFTVIPSVYTERIFPSVKSLGNLPTKISRQFTDGNIFSVFPFVFIDFLVVHLVKERLWRLYIKALKESIKLWNSDSMGNIDGKIKALELESESFEGYKESRELSSKELARSRLGVNELGIVYRMQESISHQKSRVV